MGDAEISTVHANFFVNHGRASAADIVRLIQLARAKVAEKFGVQLELEVELIGDWSNGIANNGSSGILAGNNSLGAEAGRER